MIQRWDVVFIGHPSRNRYWGESDDRAVRTPVCTCTLITGDDFRVLVDPSFSDADRMASELHRRSGLELAEVDFVFMTHGHGDHVAGLSNFPQATWLAGESVARSINASGRYENEVLDAAAHLPPEIDLVSTPGHAEGHCSLRFDCDGQSVVIAGDATITRDFCRDGLASFGAPTEQERETVRRIREMADAIVPGHGNWFLSRL